MGFYLELNPCVLSSLSIAGIEKIWIECTFLENKILFGACYRPPNQSADKRSLFLDGLHSTFNTLFDQIKHPFVLLGDFNDRCSLWGRDHQTSELKFDLVNLLNNFHLSQLINEPTQNNSILDLIITNCPGFIQSSGVDNPINDLDHCPIYGTMKFHYQKKNVFTEPLVCTAKTI